MRCPILYNITTDQEKVLYISYIKSYQAILNYIIAQKAQKAQKIAKTHNYLYKRHTAMFKYRAESNDYYI